MVTTKNKKVADRLRLLRSHGITRNSQDFKKQDGPWYYEMQSLGYNYRMPDINCALGYSQLLRIESNLQRRREIAEEYKKQFANLPLQCPTVSDKVLHAYHLFVIRTDRRTELYNFLKSKNIYCQIHYIPVHTQPYYVDLYGPQKLIETEKYYSECISLPMYHSMTVDEQSYVVTCVKEFYG
jgi:dTDP-4-amino-4,6-dideoxygalactose transaminase